MRFIVRFFASRSREGANTSSRVHASKKGTDSSCVHLAAIYLSYHRCVHVSAPRARGHALTHVSQEAMKRCLFRLSALRYAEAIVRSRTRKRGGFRSLTKPDGKSIMDRSADECLVPAFLTYLNTSNGRGCGRGVMGRLGVALGPHGLLRLAKG